MCSRERGRGREREERDKEGGKGGREKEREGETEGKDGGREENIVPWKISTFEDMMASCTFRATCSIFWQKSNCRERRYGNRQLVIRSYRYAGTEIGNSCTV